MLRGVFKHHHIFSKALIFLGLLLTGLGVSSVLAFVLSGPLFGLDAFSNPAVLTNFNDPTAISALKFMQFLNSLGVFIFPAFVFAFLVADDWKKYLAFDYLPQVIFFGIAFVSMILFLPWINLMVSWNSMMNLPEFLDPVESWMRDKEGSAEVVTMAFLEMNSFADFLFNLIIMALVPAIGEELLFRGILQQQFTHRFKNHHIGIWVAAILFSAIHMQFFGFFPRMFLGAFFGYLLVWTRSLWIPILAHFVNNAAAVSMHYFFGAEFTEEEIDAFGTSSDDWLYLVVSGILLVVLLRFTWKVRVRNT